MGRSTRKGPYVEERLEKRGEELNRQRQKKVLKTWSRRSTIIPEFVGHTVAVHNGRVRDLDDLRVVKATADGGPSMKRVSPRAMGRAFFIKHRTSHLMIELSNETARPSRAAQR